MRPQPVVGPQRSEFPATDHLVAGAKVVQCAPQHGTDEQGFLFLVEDMFRQRCSASTAGISQPIQASSSVSVTTVRGSRSALMASRIVPSPESCEPRRARIADLLPPGSPSSAVTAGCFRIASSRNRSSSGCSIRCPFVSCGQPRSACSDTGAFACSQVAMPPGSGSLPWPAPRRGPGLPQGVDPSPPLPGFIADTASWPPASPTTFDDSTLRLRRP